MRRDVTWPPVYNRQSQCAQGHGMCVAVKHNLVIVSNCSALKLDVHSLVDGSLVRSMGSRGAGRGQFNFSCGGLCVSADGDSVLVAEYYNNRVQEVRMGDGSWVRFVGEGVLNKPEYVDCDDEVVVVSESCHRISVLSWSDGVVLKQLGSRGDGAGQLNSPFGLRILGDGSGLVVADCGNHRVCVFTLEGMFVRAMGSAAVGLQYPFDVMECAHDNSFIVANHNGNNVMKMSSGGDVVGTYGSGGSGAGHFNSPSAMAALPGGGMIVRERNGNRFQVFGTE